MDPSDAVANAYRQSARDMLRGMAEFAKGDKPFAGMARAYFDEISGLLSAALH